MRRSTALQRLLYYKHNGRLDLFQKFYIINEIILIESLMIYASPPCLNLNFQFFLRLDIYEHTLHTIH